MQLLLASVLFVLAAECLLLHHGWPHALEDPATSRARQESSPAVCYFQPSDVFNCRAPNHETCIIFCLCLAWSCFSRAAPPWLRAHPASHVFSTMMNLLCVLAASVVGVLYLCLNF